MTGLIEFENATFRYDAESSLALDDVSLTIPAGSVFGIVGRSGSGKTTLTRLIQGLYPIQQGLLRIDGFDARELDLVHLRAGIGVVLLDNLLFRGTVRDNIACVKPDASFEEVAQEARLAGADGSGCRMAMTRCSKKMRRTSPGSEAAAGDRSGAHHRSATVDLG